MKTLLVGLIRSISRASDVRRAVATHSETEGCEAERETGGFEQRGLSAWMPNSERSASHRSKLMCCRRGVLERAGQYSCNSRSSSPRRCAPLDDTFVILHFYGNDKRGLLFTIKPRDGSFCHVRKEKADEIVQLT
jgi:hypothetical protein